MNRSVSSEKIALLKDVEATRSQIVNADLQGDRHDSLTTLVQRLEDLKDKLDELRLLGGRCKAVSVRTGLDRLIKVTPASQILLCNVTRLAEPVLPPDATRFSFCSLMPAPDGSFDLVTSNQSMWIDQLKCVVERQIIEKKKGLFRRKNALENVDENRVVSFEWMSGEVDCFLVESVEKKKELVEIVGVHLNRWKQRRVSRVSRIKELWAMKLQSYDKSNADHEELLRRMWTALYPEEPFEVVGPHWSRVGFQGKDPATDFRGMGVLGAFNLCFMAEHYTEQMRGLLAKKSDYPLSAAGINITMALFDLLRLSAGLDIATLYHSSPEWSTPLFRFFCRCPDEDIFQRVYSLFTLLLDAKFEEMKATYMMFNSVMKAAKEEFCQALERNPIDYSQLENWILQRIELSKIMDG